MRRLAVFCVLFIISACGGSPSGPDARCAATPDNANINIGFAAGTGTVTVTSTCAWTAASNSPALTITSGASGNGAGTIGFSVAENTGQQRIMNITLTPQGGAGVVITVTQAAPPPPIVWTLPAIAAATVGTNYAQNIATATGGTGDFHYQLDTFGGFPPLGITLGPNGVFGGTPSVAGTANFRVCAVDSSGRQLCQAMTITVNPAAGGGAFLGAWAGTIVLTDGCTTPLPSNYPWTGTFRVSASGATELVVSVPRAFVFNEVHAVTITGQQLRFTVDFDSLYTFTATFSADFRTLTGTFTGGNCSVPPTVKIPTGTWNGTKQ
jgi:hypothetical protein